MYNKDRKFGKGEMRRKEFYILLGVLIIVGVVVVMLPFLMAGQTVTTGESLEVEKADTVTCTAATTGYPFLTTKLDEMRHEIRVNMIFNEGKADVVGLHYDIEYVNEERANEAYQMLTPELNTAFVSYGASDKFIASAKFTRSDRHVIMTLYAKGEDLLPVNMEFLMVKDVVNMNGLQKEVLVENYIKMGFECK